jgi:hypothetical protein
MQSEKLETTVTQTCKEMELPECLLHGSPFARNVFFKVDEEAKKYSNVVALIDWTRNLFIQPTFYLYKYF